MKIFQLFDIMNWVITLEGIYLIDKKSGMTSFDVIRILKKKIECQEKLVIQAHLPV